MRPLVLGVLLVACALLMTAGVELWSGLSSDVHTKEPVYSKCHPEFLGIPFYGPPCPIIGYEMVATGSKPNHVPAALAVLIGGAAGAVGLGLTMLKPRSAATKSY